MKKNILLILLLFFANTTFANNKNTDTDGPEVQTSSLNNSFDFSGLISKVLGENMGLEGNLLDNKMTLAITGLYYVAIFGVLMGAISKMTNSPWCYVPGSVILGLYAGSFLPLGLIPAFIMHRHASKAPIVGSIINFSTYVVHSAIAVAGTAYVAYTTPITMKEAKKIGTGLRLTYEGFSELSICKRISELAYFSISNAPEYFNLLKERCTALLSTVQKQTPSEEL